MFDPSQFTHALQGTLAGLLGVRIVEVSPERVVAEVDMRPELSTTGGHMHGGAIMALADMAGAVGGFVNLKPGQSTITLESKTNFMSTTHTGVVRAESTPLHRGGRTSVWQTRVTNAEGRLMAVVTQTQMALDPKPSRGS